MMSKYQQKNYIYTDKEPKYYDFTCPKCLAISKINYELCEMIHDEDEARNRYKIYCPYCGTRTLEYE